MSNIVHLISHCIVNVFFTYAFVSLLEYCVHRFLMHRLALAKLLSSKSLQEVFTKHAVVHHRMYYHIFNYEPDKVGQMLNLTVSVSTGLILAILPCLAIALLSPAIALCCLIGTALHTIAWSKVHTYMHLNTDNYLTRTPMFKYLCRYHYLHHRYPNKNFNALLPLWDWILGTKAIASPDDQAEMQKHLWTVQRQRASVPH